MRKIWHFMRTYWPLAGALASSVIAFALDSTGFDTAAHWLIIITIIVELVPLLADMIAGLRQGRYGVDILAITAIVMSVLLREYWAGIVIVLMLTGGRALEDYAEHRARRELDALLTRAPQTAHVIRNNKETTVRASEVREGDTIIIRPGEVVPVDAVITEGTAGFDESNLTGESLPQVKSPGQDMLSGSVNQDGVITARALRTAEHSQYEQIIALVRAAAKSQAPFVRLADKYAIPFTVISFGIGGFAWAISGDPVRFLEVMVVATPCPLILAAPIAIISGMSRAAKHGIIIKNGSALEKLATATTFAFDKTGTLTKGEPKVDNVQSYNGFTSKEVLALAAALEQHSNHVLAQAITEKAEALRVNIPKSKNVRELAGSGLAATVGPKKVIVGRLHLLADHGINMPQDFVDKAVQSTAAFIAVNGQLAGSITFTDELRPDSKATIKALFATGIKHVVMITGDNHRVAQTVAKRLGITEFHAEALPGDKILAVEKLPNRPVAFVGDGVNDAPVLVASDLGIALGARGSTAASESADVVVMLDGLMHVAEGRHIAQRAFFIAKQSIAIGIGLSIGLMVLFATGWFKPIHGAFIQELVDVVVIFNALRAHSDRPSVTQLKLQAIKRR